MSNTNPSASRRRLQLPELPQGDVISTYERYDDAMHAVDRLAKADFPVAAVSILGNGMRSVERVVGKLTWGRVALMGALSGAYFGLFLGLLLFIFQPENESIGGVFLAAIVIGAGFGMLFSVLSRYMNRNRHDFSSVMQFVATRYDLITDPALVHQARGVLSQPDEQ